MNRTTGNSIVSAAESAGEQVRGKFVDVDGERYYAIQNVDRMPPFFISVVSNDDHWLFASSTGGLTAGRVSPQTALFPYVTVDKIHERNTHTGSRTIVRVTRKGAPQIWEPFIREQNGRYAAQRNIYKSVLGNKLRFEEINEELGLVFRYTWVTSAKYGFVRRCELENMDARPARVELLDGLQNILPAGTPLFTQTNVSNLVDAYKWTELDESTGLAFLTLYSGITDRAEPCESLRATTVFCLGLRNRTTLVSSTQLSDFRLGRPLEQEHRRRGIRGAYFVSISEELAPARTLRWQMVANTEQSQVDAVALRHDLDDPVALGKAIDLSVDEGSDRLARIIASSDGFQSTAEENVSVHHYANVLFNVLRGGVFFDQYKVASKDFARTIHHFNRRIYARNRDALQALPDRIDLAGLVAAVRHLGDPQLERLAGEYLPITFGRRHGDPSRPWNQFAIRLKDENGNERLSYEGNWRDIFQNWEALSLSFPGFIESIIAKFVNASTMDGYNPYRITKEGIDWEVEEPGNPWSYIGYWGDHQIIYLQKLLELSNRFHPARLRSLLRQPVFCYANVPYRIKSFEATLANPKSTVTFDAAIAERIAERVASTGADGKLVTDERGDVYQVNLLEKLLVPLLGKLGNLVVDGGIWLNTQRPEWNDANNALVGHGLSMVTLCYMRRYVSFLKDIIAGEGASFTVSSEVSQWLGETANALARLRPQLGSGPVDAGLRYAVLVELGKAASHYREAVYAREGFSGTIEQPAAAISAMVEDALAAIDHSIANGKRDDGLYHAYNLMDLDGDKIGIRNLYPMLEGQVAVLSAGAVLPDEAVEVLDALFASSVYRPDQKSFMLYPDRRLPDFLEKNRIAAEKAAAIPLLGRMLSKGDKRLVEIDADGCLRFNADFSNIGDLDTALDSLAEDYGADIDTARPALCTLYEDTFNHKAFTGRSGTMFGFEGLGSIYWHMVSKLLLAVQENFFAAGELDTTELTRARLGELYYRVREGIGFNKTPQEYGAFPTDPYSHTPKHAGARQPGTTGQVKEEVLTRFGELGIRIGNGSVRFDPALLRRREFARDERTYRYLDVAGEWQEVLLPGDALAFTWCQVPVIYRLRDDTGAVLVLLCDDGSRQESAEPVLSAADSARIFDRSGRIRRIELTIHEHRLFGD